MKDFFKRILDKPGNKTSETLTSQTANITERDLENWVDAKKLTFANENLKAEFAKSYSENRFKNLISNGVQNTDGIIKK